MDQTGVDSGSTQTEGNRTLYKLIRLSRVWITLDYKSRIGVF